MTAFESASNSADCGGYGLGGYSDVLDSFLDNDSVTCSAISPTAEAATSAPEVIMSAYFFARTRIARSAERDATSFWAREITYISQ